MVNKERNSLVEKLLSEFHPSNAVLREIEEGEIYQLRFEKLQEIINKISSVSENGMTNIILRRNGLEIFESYGIHGGRSSIPIGMIVSGSHLKRHDNTDLYLVTFKPTDQETAKHIKIDLADLFEEYLYSDDSQR